MMQLYRDFTTEDELFEEYNPRFLVPETSELLAEYLSESERVRTMLKNQAGIAFGPTLAEVVDIFPAAESGSPVHVFIHGGYWHSFSSRAHAFVAEALVANGVTAVLVNYALCPQVTIEEIVRQCRAAVAWTFRNITEYGGDPARITVSGHSAGGHLTGMLLATPWVADYGLPADVIKGALPISGLFDLAPFPYSWLQPKLQITWDQVRRCSPLSNLPPHPVPTIVAVGGEESAEFQRQSRDYVDRLREHGVPATFLPVPDRNHFNVVHDFRGAGGPLCKTLLELIQTDAIPD
jgi:arylformamidase